MAEVDQAPLPPELADQRPDATAADDEGIDHAESPEALKSDKAALKTGDSWMEINMGDTDGRAIEREAPSPTQADTGEDAIQGDSREPAERNSEDGDNILPEQVSERKPQRFTEVIPGEQAVQSPPDLLDRHSISPVQPEAQQPPTPSSDISQRLRSDSRSTTNTFGTQRSTPVSSTVFVVTALDTIRSSKEAKRSKELGESVEKALANMKLADQHGIDPEIIFRPLRLATKTFSIPLQTTALDCIGKLITYSYFAFPTPQDSSRQGGEHASGEPPLIERAIETICDCFENEATPVEIQQQIIKSLLAAVLNDKIVVHGAGLLKAVRQIYNIFIYSKSSTNQMVAQGSLTQMVGTVFDRVRVRLAMKEARITSSKLDREDGNQNQSDDNLGPETLSTGLSDTNGAGDADGSDEASTIASDQPTSKEPGEKLTLQSFETSKNMDDAVVNDNAPTMVTRAKHDVTISRSVSGQHSDDTEADEEEDEIYIKDAFLVFRSLCKLSHKVLPMEQQQDIKSQNMRSKLLSLHLIHNLLNNHMMIFTSSLAVIKSSTNGGEHTTFMQAAKPHLCLSLSRNGSSSIQRVFEVCCEIFWLMLKNLRVMLKKELEVFLKEIYLAILERKNAPVFQRQHFMDVLERLSSDPRALVEIYLNYDCDRTALDNMYQIIIEQLSRISSTPVTVTASQQQQYQEHHLRVPGSAAEWHQRGTLPPSLATASVHNNPQTQQPVPSEYIMKQQALESLVEILRSLDNWASQGIADAAGVSRDPVSRNSFEESRESLDTARGQSESSPRIMGVELGTGQSTPVLEDDPSQIAKAKERKTALGNGIKQFNFKPKRGVKALITDGFIKSESPDDIAIFLITNERLDKAMIGEYLGEGDAQNVAIMHAFVDSMDFTKRRFVDALRTFLQSFRLPGEAQKIDRFMLKFAERYLSGNPNAFANADTAYVLAYSVIMLNTDQHSSKIARRMTKEDFIKNNRGINDNHDLPDEYLSGIFEEISQHEIVLDTERDNAAALGLAVQAPTGGLASRAGQVLATVGRDLQREKYAQASEEMANKTEQLYRSLIRAQRKTAVKSALSKFIPATSFRHVGPMFNVTWMSFLSGLSGQVQDTQNLDIIRLCMEGLKLAIRISCLFDLETPRVAFVTALAKFTNLGNLKEMMAKNVEALKVLLEVALMEGNLLKGSWRDILTCISQLDRFQLLSGGVDESSIPDVSKARIVNPSNGNSLAPRRSTHSGRKARPRSTNSATYQPEVALESRSLEMNRQVDRIFTNTANLSTDAIIDFIQGLSEVSWQEIQSSGESDSPRTYSLQKLVEISYYNMTRVRIEWTKIWEVLGEHFVQVGCNTNNTAVVYFALDSLRQLSMRFMEIEELPGFKFQKDFLKPFEHVIANSNVVAVKDMVLRCLIQMIQAKGDNIRSGWKTMFGVFTVAAKEPYEGIVRLAYEHVTHIYNNRFGVVISQGSFADLVVCLTEFSKNLRFQKTSLQAIETLKSTIPKMLKTPECPLSYRHTKSRQNGTASLPNQPNPQTQEEQFWYPVLIAFQDVLMTGEDLEVRSRALTYLFETLVRYGGDFPPEFWDILWRQLLYPIFVVLQSKSEMSKVPNHEDLSVWLSTTMIQALRNMITLFTHYFESLEWMLDRFLNLLILCICQENDTIARIGSNCLQQLILQNVNKFRPEHWSKIVGAFVELFYRTTAQELFTAAAPPSLPPTPVIHTPAIGNASQGEYGSSHSVDAISSTSIVNEKTNGVHPAEPESETTLDSSGTTVREITASSMQTPTSSTPTELEDYRPASPVQQQPIVVTAARRRFFNKIITNCVLQLLMIETVNELFSNDAVYAQIPSPELLRLMGLLKSSYQFAKKFNSNKELRMRLWREGFMKQPPNLLKQESGSAATYVNILVRMYHDEGEERKSSRTETEEALVPLCADIIRSYVELDEETQQRNIIAWRPVVVDVMEGYTNFPRDAFEKHIETFYPLGVELLSRDVGVEVRLALQSLLRRIGEVRMGMPPFMTPTATPTSPRSVANAFPGNTGGRRTSRGR